MVTWFFSLPSTNLFQDGTPFAICHLPFAICYRGPAIGYWSLVVTLFTHRTLKIPSISKVFKAFQRKSFYPQKKAAGTLFKNLSTH